VHYFSGGIILVFAISMLLFKQWRFFYHYSDHYIYFHTPNLLKKQLELFDPNKISFGFKKARL
jgi:hypothetical protein